MSHLGVVEGRLSANYNSFKGYKLASVRATNTRLMGVVALLFEWRATGKNPYRLYQIIHLDYSEYGIDDYYEFMSTEEDLSNDKNYRDMERAWEKMTSAMGAKISKIPVEYALKLIDLAIAVYQRGKLYTFGKDPHKRFRVDAAKEVDMMKEYLGLEDALTPTLAAYEKVVPKKLSTYEVINYFLMRLADRDYSVLPLLTDIDVEDLSATKIPRHGLQTLMKNSITPIDEEAGIYESTFVTLGAEYYYGIARFTLDGSARDADGAECYNRKIIDFEILHFTRLSAYEAAMQTTRSEFITVYDLGDDLLESFDIGTLRFFENSIYEPVLNGFMYTLYNKDNSHVDNPDYWLNDDIYATALMSMGGELVVMSYIEKKADNVEKQLIFYVRNRIIRLKGRYEIGNQVFKTLCDAPGAKLKELIKH